MLIGEDYPKIKIDLSGYIIYEPNVFITDIIMSAVCFYIAFRLFGFLKNSNFNKWWFLFFATFTLSTLSGAFGHAFFYYWGPQGKIISWSSSIIGLYFLERAMISQLINVKYSRLFVLLSKAKMGYFLCYIFWIFLFISDETINKIGFVPIAINTIVGVSLTAGIMARYLKRKSDENFKWIYYGVLVIVPSAFIFLFRINFFNWLDKNDLSHLFITAGFILFYKGVKLISLKRLNNNENIELNNY